MPIHLTKTARTILGIYQEVTALMVFMLLAAELEAVAYERFEDDIQKIDTSEDQHHQADPPIRFNRVVIATHIMIIVRSGFTKGPAAVAACMATALDDIWRYRQRIKRGRSFKRISRNPSGKWSNGRP